MRPQVKCSTCQSAYSDGAWLGLPVVQTLTCREVGAFVVGWDEGRVIEVRACPRCGKSMARTRDAAA